MTEAIRQELRQQLLRDRMRQKDLAAKAGLSEKYISLVLTGERLEVPKKFQRLLDALGLELTVQPKVVRRE